MQHSSLYDCLFAGSLRRVHQLDKALVEKGQEDQLAYVQALDPEHFLSFL